MTNFYDGNVRGVVNWDGQFVRIDSFQNDPAPFRLVYYPFYTQINEIIKYSLTTKDSIQTYFQDYGDSVWFQLKIINKHVFFHIKPIVLQNQSIPEDEITQFDIWFSKKDKMPYRIRSKWHHAINISSSHGVKFNFKNDIVFHADEYYPSHFQIVQFVRGEPQIQKTDLVGQKAPDWTLKDSEDKDVKLSELNAKTLVIWFTGIGCAPCHQAIPFLKQLAEDYKTKDFELIAIETWGGSIEALKRYGQANEFNFSFLQSTDELKKSYGIAPVPAFFIVDQNRIVRKIINGYSKGNTDKEIIESIENL